MKVEPRTVVSLTYELHVTDTDGSEPELVERVEADQPLVFLYGIGNMLEKFEKNLEGLTQGDTFDFSLQPTEGYGEVDEEAVVRLPIHIFEVDGKVDTEMVKEGNTLPMMDQDGNQMQGRVLEVADDSVLMDFNHPLAGLNMHFTGKVINIREATLEELSHRHVHGPGGHHH
ncbi:FKBP-type peptidyl-prolyl cis-trans isomerase [Xanthocytophaga agilis]|uniref:Peptidyl-prolyl cis-trans isomerase n=1 Tax=Xanthocytophaga agilis TaxID=3048010 RepID=A0AAE3RB86_9BACT|nr:FKBP-type peptidyl-prolyl cis-trans isomerase [Xanthocytophaga agilis]MDJ1506690.1 FKBP-type peptidyl-prolyl cis-trans isomerase [Xanthocytophaga agilis]